MCCLAQVLLKVDSDTHLSPDFLLYHSLPHSNMYYAGDWRLAPDENSWHLNGVVLVRREHFTRVHGYDERMRGYGWDDTDLYYRLSSSLNLSRRVINFSLLSHQSAHHISRGQTYRRRLSEGVFGEEGTGESKGVEGERRGERREGLRYRTLLAGGCTSSCTDAQLSSPGGGGTSPASCHPHGRFYLHLQPTPSTPKQPRPHPPHVHYHPHPRAPPSTLPPLPAPPPYPRSSPSAACGAYVGLLSSRNSPPPS